MRPIISALAAGAVILTAAPAAASPPSEREPIHTWRAATGGTYGFAVSQLADVDHDRVPDAIIGAARYRDASGQVRGRTEVRSGRSGRLIYEFVGAPGDAHGYAMADAGDVNRDGVPDIVVGATGEPQLMCTAAPGAGRVYVYSGRDGRTLLTVGGEAAGDQFGAAVGAAGDVDRDGRPDLVVGAPCHDGPGGVDAGKAYVVSGRTGRVVRTHDGAEPGDGFGWGAAGLGGTRYVVGAKDAGPGDRGLAYVYDGWRAAPRFVLSGDARSVDFGWYFVATAGRVDHDRVPDIYVGDFCAEDDAGQCGAPLGQAYVFSGRTGRLLHLFRGQAPGDGAGPGRSAGDVNRDGRDDIAVGFYASSTGATNAGRIVVYSGRTGRILYDRVGTVAGELLGYDVVGLGDVNRDGRVDLLASAAGGNTVYVLST
jgi:hypothetical protein